MNKYFSFLSSIRIISDTVEMLKGTHATSRGTMKFYDKELRRIFDEVMLMM